MISFFFFFFFVNLSNRLSTLYSMKRELEERREETTSLSDSSFSFPLAAVRVFQPKHVYIL